MKAAPDLQFSNLGFAASCVPLTDAGKDWLAENLAGDATEYGGSILIEYRYLGDIIYGARAAGLVCEG